MENQPYHPNDPWGLEGPFNHHILVGCGLRRALQLLHMFNNEALRFELLLECFGLGFGDVHDAQIVLAHRMDPSDANHGREWRGDQERM
jgi:hypothetical protein